MTLSAEAGGSVLISDDDEFFRVALRSILKDQLGFEEVVETDSFDPAIERLGRSDAISLALFDLRMPGMQNPEGLRAIRENFPDVRVAVVSASRRRSDILNALQAGVHGYVHKGVGVAELSRALSLICEGRIYIPPSLADISEEDGEAAPIAPAPPPAERALNITPRQGEVLQLLVEGRSNKEMARALDLSESAIKFHLAALFRQLGVRNRVEAATAGARLLDRG